MMEEMCQGLDGSEVAQALQRRGTKSDATKSGEVGEAKAAGACERGLALFPKELWQKSGALTCAKPNA